MREAHYIQNGYFSNRENHYHLQITFFTQDVKLKNELIMTQHLKKGELLLGCNRCSKISFTFIISPISAVCGDPSYFSKWLKLSYSIRRKDWRFKKKNKVENFSFSSSMCHFSHLPRLLIVTAFINFSFTSAFHLR